MKEIESLQPDDKITNGNQTLTVQSIKGLDSLRLIVFSEFPKQLFNYDRINFEGWSLV